MPTMSRVSCACVLRDYERVCAIALWDSLRFSTQEKFYYAVFIATDAFSSSTAKTDVRKHQVTELVISSSGNSVKRLWCDLKGVEHGNSTEFRSTILSQLMTLGVKSWLCEIPSNCFGAWIIVGDEGPDVMGGVP